MNFINKINKYLIDRYPTIWNTRIVWMLALSMLLHILFFFIGYVSHNNPVSLQNSGVIDDFFSSGFILVNIIISVLLLVGWLVYMFKNNGFKNFYPTSNWKLFGQFVSYLVIIFASITFYFSYMFGFRTYINQAYPNNEFVKDVAIINKAYPFLSLEYQDFELDKKAYPKMFMDLYCETNSNYIHYSEPFYTLKDKNYQFFRLYEVAVTERDVNRDFKYPAAEYKKGTELAYKNIVADTCFYYFKKEVVDVSSHVKSAEFSYYNFSRAFYTVDFNTVDYFDRYNNSYKYPEPTYNGMYGVNLNANKNYNFSKDFAGILNRKNPQEIKKILNDFLEVSKKYQIKTDLSADTWFKMVYHPTDFEVKHFIASEKPSPRTYYTATADSAAVVINSAYEEVEVAQDAAATVSAAVATENENLLSNYYYKKLSKNYYEISNLNYLLRSVELVKTVDFVSRSIHVYIWMAFFLSTLIFCFRVTNLRAVLFSGVTAGVLSLVVGLISLLYAMGVSNDEEYFVAYLVLAISTIVLLIPLLFVNFRNKLFTAIFMNISINGFVLYVLLILGIISMHQNDACREMPGYYDSYAARTCTTLLEDLDMNTSYILLAAGLIFIFLYTAVIKKWRAVPE
ncbi:hypothetical protein MG290_03315 [Flavobacterium sp. CBA20B-1]|uniref:hypothetical protein n=1 Tax=unclassified Flavobacterium TaxID=196869 RepID=UPI0022258067|nr:MULTISPECIES: hypothetical protein [unclassified Flavobacterium]WCM42722.1 hypothetical protein MG290_03315 [Flavobacterium sp. CBA20B-1]